MESVSSRNEVVDECRKAKRNYLELKLNRNRSNPERIWGTLKGLLKGDSLNENYKEIQYGDIIINNMNEMANLFNRFFVDSISGSVEDTGAINLAMDKYTECEYRVFKPIDLKQLNQIVDKLENKSGTEEGITVEVMKKVIAIAGKTICRMLNRS